MNDVAVKAGVSRTTASFVLNGREDAVRISPETRDRIWQSARELGYRRNEMARAVVSGKRRFLGLLMKSPSLDVEYKSRVLTGVLDAASELDFNVKMINLASDAAAAEAFSSCVEWRMAGVIAVALDPHLINAARKELEDHQIFMAVVGGQQPHDWGTHVVAEGKGAIALAVKHLHCLGHRRIGFVNADASDTTARSREQHFVEAMGELGLHVPPGYICHGDWWEPEPNERAARAILGLPQPPTALLCAGDPISMVVLNVARNKGMKVPQDLSIIGFGDYALVGLADPPLATLAQPFQEMGRRAVELLVERVRVAESKQDGVWRDPDHLEELPVQLLARASTAAPPPQ